MFLIEKVRAGDGSIVGRERPQDAPTHETFEARLDQIGPFITIDVPATGGPTALLLSGIAGITEAVMGRAGSIVGITARSNADLTAGTVTYRVQKNGVVAGDLAPVVLSDLVQGASGLLTTPVDFVAGDRIGCQFQSVGAAPITTDQQAWVLVRWAPT